MGKALLRIAVVSDLHFVNRAFIKNGDAHSWLSFGPDGELDANFWDTLLEKIKTDQIKADLLVCPGDITTHAENSALKFAWAKLEELAKALGCKLLAAATGNHDVCSRKQPMDHVIRGLDAGASLVENLKQLDPPYPLLPLDEAQKSNVHQNRIHYFGADYILHDLANDYRLVLFNSCASHTSDPTDYERGYIGNTSLDWLEESLKSIYDPQNKKLGIFVCHHHPIQHADHNLGTYDFIKGGVKLIEMLNKYGNWIVIHGHKHHAKLSYQSDGSKKTVVFSAGTLSSHKKTLGVEFTNQFYIVNADPNKTKGTPTGTLDVYSWRGNHWSLSKNKKDGVFTGIGFGDVGCMEGLAESMSKSLTGVTLNKWEDVVNKFPQLNHCVPRDWEYLESCLQELNVDMVCSPDSEILGLQKSKV